MHSKDGFHCCYNVQNAVDKGSHLIAAMQGVISQKNAKTAPNLKVFPQIQCRLPATFVPTIPF
jgi:hypothetical protein